jgi:gluconokinase
VDTIVLTGVAGSGKTTVGELLAARLGIPLLDADELHSPEAIARMRAGIALTDDHRRPWLARVAAAIDARRPLVVGCSALSREARARLRAVGDIRLFLLDVPRATLERRLLARRGHFFGPALLDSQLDTLERPSPEEDVLVIDADRPATAVADAVMTSLG